ncbi:LysR family transcriptional regulator [Coralliovum pocilloporae]|uniref:LysR family transcriptional regulator n=1 Tax=Coralliovum pocilloporae TaxID=3066369 RepID=UPI003307BCAA
MDTLTRMRTFLQVVESGGFSAAARDMGRSKALVSKYVRELEDELGVRLLYRTTRQLSLTEAGEIYVQDARQVIEQLDMLHNGLKEKNRNPHGVLKLSVPRTFGDEVLSPAIMEFLEAQPDVSLQLKSEDRQIDLIEEGIDVAIRISELKDTSLIARKLAPFRIAICGSRRLIEKVGRPETPLDLANLPCVSDVNTVSRSRWSFMVEGERVLVPVGGRVEVNSPHATKAAMLTDLGFGIVPYFMVREEVERGELELVLDDYMAESRAAGVYVVFPHRRHMSGKVRAFVDFMVAWFDRATKSGQTF